MFLKKVVASLTREEAENAYRSLNGHRAKVETIERYAFIRIEGRYECYVINDEYLAYRPIGKSPLCVRIKFPYNMDMRLLTMLVSAR